KIISSPAAACILPSEAYSVNSLGISKRGKFTAGRREHKSLSESSFRQALCLDFIPRYQY
ncbi:MAG: hypothetical protein IKE08_08550, partial [Clostridia bacterium]|nr:hypothetical protein [Clostridia bacterium]